MKFWYRAWLTTCTGDMAVWRFRYTQIYSSSILTSWCRVLLDKLTGLQLVRNFMEPEGSLPHSQVSATCEKLTGLQLVKKFPAFHGTRRLITALTSAHHLSLSWASPIQSIYPHPTSWISILILSTHLRLGLPSGLLPSGFPTKSLYPPLSLPIRTTCPPHISPHYLTKCTILGGEKFTEHKMCIFIFCTNFA